VVSESEWSEYGVGHEEYCRGRTVARGIEVFDPDLYCDSSELVQSFE